jgi:hypothetical protein
MYCVLIISALRATEAAFPVLQNHLAEMGGNILGPAYSLQCLHSQRDFVCVGSGIHSAINGKIRPGNVRGLRTGDERH